MAITAEQARAIAYKVARGRKKYKDKIERMKTEYAAAKDKAVKKYGAVGFKSEFVDAYTSAWEYMPDVYKAVMVPGKGDIWLDMWLTKMFTPANKASIEEQLKKVPV